MSMSKAPDPVVPFKEITALLKLFSFLAALSLLLLSCGTAPSPSPASPVSGASPAPTPAPAEFHVAVSGDDSNPGTADLPFASLERARDAVREINQAMQEPITVVVHGGTYPLSEPIVFTTADSGQNGHEILYRAAQGERPVFSGGIEAGGWEPVPGSAHWKTTLPEVDVFRQVYVDGVRAQRAASQEPVTGFRWAAGETGERDGIVIASDKIPELARPRDLELHWIYDWKDMRLPVDDIQQTSGEAKTIWMRQPWYSHALSMEFEGGENHQWIPAYDIPFYLENAFELMDQPGEWYYNAHTHELFYIPRDGEDLRTAEVVIPQTRILFDIRGEAFGKEVHDLAFEGLSFQYAGWTRANLRGVFGHQAQQLLVSPGWCEACLEMTPAHVQVNNAYEVRIEGCRFERLGAAGLHLNDNVHDITVQGNLFRDLSDGAIVVGHWDHVYANPLKTARRSLIANNRIEDVGVEYWGAPAITAYYVDHVQILHNQISHVSYTGISLGWGWSSWTDSTTAHDNRVAFNLITDLTQRARDGGGIYTLGQQPRSVIEGNVVRRMRGDYGCLYSDEGSAFYLFQNNVCDSAPEWLAYNPGHDVQILNTYTNVRAMASVDQGIHIENTVHVDGQAWPPEAQAILDNAGLEPAYAYLHEWLEE
jgi:hypothetical protein